MTPFELAEPSSLREAIALLDPEDPSVRPLGGGTALMLMMKSGVFAPTRIVSLRGLEPKLFEIKAGAEGLRIGAMAALGKLERSEEVRKAAPVITRTLRTLSNVRVRNVATLGGHLAHADPHTDLPPVLITLDARVIVTGPQGERTIAIQDLFAGYFETVLARDELISALVVPAQGARRACYLKCTTRAVHDWPALGVAVSLDSDGDTVRNASVVISAATEKPTRLAAVENLLRGARLDDALLRQAGEAAADAAELISDGQGSAAYKKQLVRVYVARALRAALEPDSGARH
jgi:carbon-monoxide dehydrogenase medium subunit